MHGDVAVARYAYGEGRSVFVGFNLLSEALISEAAAGSSDNSFTTLLLKALEDVNPDSLTYTEGLAVPLTLTITNQGTATTGQLTINLPAGSQVLDNGGAQQVPQANNATNLIWPVTLANNATATLTFWLQLPQDQTVALITAAIESNAGGASILHTPAELSLPISVPPSLDDIISELSPLSGLDPDYAAALSYLQQAQTALANGNGLMAHLKLLEAAEELGEDADEVNRPEAQTAKNIRTKLDGLIRKMALGL